MLRSWRNSAGGGATALLLAAAWWIVSASGASAAPPKAAAHPHAASSAKVGHAHPAGASAKPAHTSHATGAFKPAGANRPSPFLTGSLVNLEHQLQHEAAEVQQLEQSLTNLLDDDGYGNQGQNYQGYSGSQGSQGLSSGSSANGYPQSGAANSSSARRHHHRHGYIGRGMQLAQLMYTLQREEQTLAHLERNLGRELAGLRSLEHNLHNLHHSGTLGHRMNFDQRIRAADHARTIKSGATSKAKEPGLQVINRFPGQSHMGAGEMAHFTKLHGTQNSKGPGLQIINRGPSQAHTKHITVQSPLHHSYSSTKTPAANTRRAPSGHAPLGGAGNAHAHSTHNGGGHMSAPQHQAARPAGHRR